MVNYDELDPGIRKTVRWLNELGFETTDSGDGITKLEAGWPEDELIACPHVVIKVPPQMLVRAARNLKTHLEYAGFCVEPTGYSNISIQASYDPTDDSAIIVLLGISDKAWKS